MIIDWAGGRYLDGPGPAFLGPRADSWTGAGFGLLHNLWAPIRAEYSAASSAEASLSAGFALVYNLWGPVRAESGTGPSGLSSWQADGTGGCDFTGPLLPVIWWRCDGESGGTWTLLDDEASGFYCDGEGTCEFTAAGSVEGGLRMQGNSTATFILESRDPLAPVGWRMDGLSTCQFYGTMGTDEECLTSGVGLAGGDLPNFVF